MTKEIDRSGTRSSKYQYKFAEISIDPNTYIFYDDRVSYIKTKEDIDEENKIIALKDKLYNICIKLFEYLTERQKGVMILWLQDLTQKEMAGDLNISQSTITKTLYGSESYKTVNGTKRNERKFYGGAFRKLKLLAKENEEVLNILNELKEFGINL